MFQHALLQSPAYKDLTQKEKEQLLDEALGYTWMKDGASQSS